MGGRGGGGPRSSLRPRSLCSRSSAALARALEATSAHASCRSTSRADGSAVRSMTGAAGSRGSGGPGCCSSYGGGGGIPRNGLVLEPSKSVPCTDGCGNCGKATEGRSDRSTGGAPGSGGGGGVIEAVMSLSQVLGCTVAPKGNCPTMGVRGATLSAAASFACAAESPTESGEGPPAGPRDRRMS